MTGEEVLAARQARKMSRKAFAKATGLTETKVHNIEKGRTIKPEEEAILIRFLDGGAVPPVATEEVSAPGPGPVSETAPPPPQSQPEIPAAERKVSNSEVQTWKRCRRKWWFAYYRKLKLITEPTTGPRALGLRAHYALAEFYRTGRHPVEVFNETVVQDYENTPEEQHEDIKKQADLGRIMLEGYLDWVAESGADAGLSIVGIEQAVEVPSGVEGVNLLGRLDMRVRREVDDAQLFLDHKTVGNLTEPIRTLHMDEQMLMYHLLEYLLLSVWGQGNARYTDGGLYNMLKKVKRTSQATPPFYDRVEVRHNIHELRSYYLRVMGTIRDILEATKLLDEGNDARWVAYPTPMKNCTWDCDFFAICPMFDDGSNAEGLLTSIYIEGDPYERYTDPEVIE